MDAVLYNEMRQLIESKKKLPQGGVVTQRDVIAMRWVSEQGVMTVDQLWRAVWMTDIAKESRYAYVRVSFLERAGFLEKLKTPFYQQSHYRLTHQGHSFISGKVVDTLIPSQKTPLLEIPHVHVLTEMRLAAQRANKSKSWRTDRMLAIDATFPKERLDVTLPDAIWITQETGRKIALEYERTQKSRSRVRYKVDALSREMARPDRLFDLVLWIAEPGAYQNLKSILGNHPNQRLRQLDQFLVELKGDLS